MGSLVNAIRQSVGVANEKEIKERLELLLVAAKGKIRGYRDEINEQFMNPAMIDKIQIPGIRAIRFIEQYHVAAKSSFNQQVGDHLTNAIDAFFSIGGKDQNTKAAVQSGVKSLISAALDGFIGSTEAGETEEKIYIVVPENNAFVRADICVWKYHMSDNALGSNTDTAVAYVLCKSVIDHTKIKIDELIYLVSETLAKRTQPYVEVEVPVKEWVPDPSNPEHLMLKDKTMDVVEPEATDPNKGTVKKKPVTIKKKFLLDPVDPSKKKLLDKTKSADDPSNWGEYLGGSGGVPPSMSDVESYIDELVRVWKKLKEELG